MNSQTIKKNGYLQRRVNDLGSLVGRVLGVVEVDSLIHGRSGSIPAPVTQTEQEPAPSEAAHPPPLQCHRPHTRNRHRPCSAAASAAVAATAEFATEQLYSGSAAKESATDQPCSGSAATAKERDFRVLQNDDLLSDLCSLHCQPGTHRQCHHSSLRPPKLVKQISIIQSGRQIHTFSTLFR